MWVEPELLHSGGTVSRNAGEHLLGGALALSAAPIAASMFGDFDAAKAFHQRLSQHHIGQVTEMRNNHRRLDDVGTKAKSAAISFAETERRNGEDMSNIADA